MTHGRSQIRGAEHERACLVCRTARPADELLALTQVQGPRGQAVVCLGRDVAPATVRTGRGAWVCVDRKCLGQVSPKTLGRAFKGPVQVPEAWRGAGLITAARDWARQRILEQLGLARRQGDITLGAEQLDAPQPASAVRICAADLAERTLQRARGAGAWVVLDADTLGRATGTGRAGVLTVAPGRTARQLAYWLQVYTACQIEAAPAGGTGGDRSPSDAEPTVESTVEPTRAGHDTRAKFQQNLEQQHRFFESPWVPLRQSCAGLGIEG